MLTKTQVEQIEFYLRRSNTMSDIKGFNAMADLIENAIGYVIVEDRGDFKIRPRNKDDLVGVRLVDRTPPPPQPAPPVSIETIKDAVRSVLEEMRPRVV